MDEWRNAMSLARTCHSWIAVLAMQMVGACAVEVGTEPEQGLPIEPVAEALSNPAKQFTVWSSVANPLEDQDYFPPSSFRQNVTKIVRTAVGDYTVFLSEPIDPTFVVAVAFGPDTRRCKAADLLPGYVRVICHLPNGDPANAKFVLNGFTIDASTTGRAAGGKIDPAGSSAFNTVGTVGVTHPSTGNYNIFLSGGLGTGARGGTVQVAARGLSADHCKVASWGPDLDFPQILAINVRCFKTNSADPVDTPFNFFYDEEILTQTNRGAYAFANNETSGFYHPPTRFTFSRGPTQNGTSTNASASLVQTGQYKMVYHGPSEVTASKSYAFAGAYGTSPDYCKILDWDIPDSCETDCDMEVYTACFDKSGVLKNSKYVQTWGSWRALAPD
jgi:hypothetical protein